MRGLSEIAPCSRASDIRVDFVCCCFVLFLFVSFVGGFFVLHFYFVSFFWVWFFGGAICLFD